MLAGLGMGLNTGPVNAVAVAAVPPARSGSAAALINVARIVATTLGVAVLGAGFALAGGMQPGCARHSSPARWRRWLARSWP